MYIYIYICIYKFILHIYIYIHLYTNLQAGSVGWYASFGIAIYTFPCPARRPRSVIAQRCLPLCQWPREHQVLPRSCRACGSALANFAPTMKTPPPAVC